MEIILSSIGSQDRSAFIREMLIIGMKESGVLKKVPQKTFVRDLSDVRDTKVLPESDPVQHKNTTEDIDPVFGVAEDVEVDDLDLDRALDDLEF